MKLLVVHEVSYLRKVIYEIHEFPEHLALRGHEITFLDFDEGATRATRAKERLRTIRGRIHPQVNIQLATPHSFGLASIDRLWAIFSVVPLLCGILSKQKFDAVLNYAVPTYGLQVSLISKFFGVPVMHRALDVASKIRRSPWNPLIRIWEKLIFRLADLISANNPAMETYLKANLPLRSHRNVVLHYPPLDTQIFFPVPRDSSLGMNLGIRRDDRVLVYMGSFFYFSGIPSLLRQLAPRIALDSHLKVLLVGGGEQEVELRNLAKQLMVDDQVIFTGYVPFAELPRYMTLGDVAVNPLENSLVAGAAFPHKVLQYMAVGLPVVSTKLEGLHAAFSETSGITWVEDESQVAEKCLDLLNSEPQNIEQIRHLQLLTVKRLFSVQSTVSALESTLFTLVKEREKK